jgi:hypothetical protein
VEALSLAARGLLISAATYSARNLLDGRIDHKWVCRQVPNKRQRMRIVLELVDEGLWREVESGFESTPLHDDGDHPERVYARSSGFPASQRCRAKTKTPRRSSHEPSR